MNANDLTEDRVATLQSLLNTAAQHIGQKRQRIAKLEALLADCAEFIEPYSDVSDGAYGEPVPNAAMALLSEINEEIT
jgi:enamine deaminase RidA (YjgF/YER057c/UK114 family)